MKKDIDFPKVEGVQVAVVQNEDGWYVYIINKNLYTLHNVLVTSRGYGTIGDEKRETSVLRHSLGDVDPEVTMLIEPIDPNIFILNNEYWVSYYANGQVYDKKYIFVQGSIIEENFTIIPELSLKGVLHN